MEETENCFRGDRFGMWVCDIGLRKADFEGKELKDC